MNNTKSILTMLSTTILIVIITGMTILFQLYIGFIFSIFGTIIMFTILKSEPSVIGMMLPTYIFIVMLDILLTLFIPYYTFFVIGVIILFYISVYVEIVKSYINTSH